MEGRQSERNVARTKTKIDLLLSTNYVFINIQCHTYARTHARAHPYTNANTIHNKKLLEISYDGNDFQLFVFISLLFVVFFGVMLFDIRSECGRSFNFRFCCCFFSVSLSLSLSVLGLVCVLLTQLLNTDLVLRVDRRFLTVFLFWGLKSRGKNRLIFIWTFPMTFISYAVVGSG